MSMTVDWMIGTDDHWCALKSIDLDSYCFDHDLRGVFIIWTAPTETEEGRVIYVGHGVLKIQLGKIRDEPFLSRYDNRDLLVTWAEVDHGHEASVEAYLVTMLNPVFGERHSNAIQTMVNLPAW